MVLLPSPAGLRRAANKAAVTVARKVLRIDVEPQGEWRKVPDDLPRDSIFAQPLVVTATASAEPEHHEDGTVTVTFRVVLRDAQGKRCSDLHVEARMTGPEREAVGETTTDMLGAARFKMRSTPGEYAIEVVSVAGLALDWDRDASTATASVTVDAA